MGLRVELAQINHGEYVMAFYMDHTHDHLTALLRCWPNTEIKVSLAEYDPEGYKSYDILLLSDKSSGHGASKRDGHYDPESMRDTKDKSMINDFIIPGCWKMSSSRLENLYNKGKLPRKNSLHDGFGS